MLQIEIKRLEVYRNIGQTIKEITKYQTYKVFFFYNRTKNINIWQHICLNYIVIFKTIFSH